MKHFKPDEKRSVVLTWNNICISYVKVEAADLDASFSWCFSIFPAESITYDLHGNGETKGGSLLSDAEVASPARLSKTTARRFKVGTR